MARALASVAKVDSAKNNSNHYHIENITIFEKASCLEKALSASASGNPIGVLHPMITKHVFSREWTDEGILTTLRWIKELEISSKFYSLCGVLHLPRDIKQANQWSNWNDYKDLKSKYMTKSKIKKNLNLNIRDFGAMWTPQCGWVKPIEFLKAALEETKKKLGKKINLVFNSKIISNDITSLNKSKNSFSNLKSFDVVIISAGYGSKELIKVDTSVQNKKPIIELVNGQITSLPIEKSKLSKNIKINHVICRSGYITPIVDGFIHFGATYENIEKPHSIPTYANRLENLKRLEELSNQKKNLIDFKSKSIIDRVSTRCVSKDRLPIIGILEKKQHHIYAFSAFGSRGLSWCPNAAEKLAQIILCKNVNNLASSMDKYIFPGRFGL